MHHSGANFPRPSIKCGQTLPSMRQKWYVGSRSAPSLRPLSAEPDSSWPTRGIPLNGEIYSSSAVLLTLSLQPCGITLLGAYHSGFRALEGNIHPMSHINFCRRPDSWFGSRPLIRRERAPRIARVPSHRQATAKVLTKQPGEPRRKPGCSSHRRGPVSQAR